LARETLSEDTIPPSGRLDHQRRRRSDFKTEMRREVELPHRHRRGRLILNSSESEPGSKRGEEDTIVENHSEPEIKRREEGATVENCSEPEIKREEQVPVLKNHSKPLKNPGETPKCSHTARPMDYPLSVSDLRTRIDKVGFPQATWVEGGDRGRLVSRSSFEGTIHDDTNFQASLSLEDDLERRLHRSRTEVPGVGDLPNHPGFLGPRGCSRVEYRADLREILEPVKFG
jgi:hypothetical protein